MHAMKLVVGLGNPGSRYDHTRHNAGFLLLEDLAQRTFRDEPYQLRIISPWRERFKGRCAEAEIFQGNSSRAAISRPASPELPQVKLEPTRALLLMPQTFMNLSGESTQEALAFYKLNAEDLFVCHDDIDLPFGTIRVRQGGGEGGHNGLRSIATQLGSKHFFRVRIGVGRPGAPTSGDGTSSSGLGGLTDAQRHASVSDWVLSGFSPDEQKQLPTVLSRAGEALLMLITRGLGFTQQHTHRSQ